MLALAERTWARELSGAHGYILSLPKVTPDDSAGTTADAITEQIRAC